VKGSSCLVASAARKIAFDDFAADRGPALLPKASQELDERESCGKFIEDPPLLVCAKRTRS
jgi:hypothetical protein